MEILHITSRRDPRVRNAAALRDSPGQRRKEGLFLCEGARLCEDAAVSGVKIKACFFTQRAKEKYSRYLEEIARVCEEGYLVEEPVAQLLSSTKTYQGIFCLCESPRMPGGSQREKPFQKSSCVVLENVQDPGNLGGVLRTAEALGVGQVFLLGDCCDPLSPKALRSSMGAVFRLELRKGEDPLTLCRALREEGFTLLAAVPDHSALKVTELSLSSRLCAVFIGNEGNGLREETISLCDKKMTIPMLGRAESLNALSAAAILIWEMKRKEGQTDADF